jgi:S1-C subfamily serine protease
MTPSKNWQIAPNRQPRQADYDFDLDQTLASIVALHTVVPEQAMTAATLGTERGGHGVVIRDGLVLTIGYIITEAEEVWITLADGRTIPGHPLVADNVTGFGLVQALDRLDLPPIALGNSSAARLGSRVVTAAAGGRRHAIAARIVAKQEFAGYWEYVLDKAIFTAPAHPFWGGAALLGRDGALLGIGSLQVEHKKASGETTSLNMVVPIDLLKANLDDFLSTGRAKGPPRAWLGLFATEVDGQVVVAGLYDDGPAESGGVKPGDLILSVGGTKIESLAQFFREVWRHGPAGTELPLTIGRGGQAMQLRVTSGERDRFLWKPRMH